MLETIFRPLRSLLDVAEHAVTIHTPLEKTEEDILDTVKALHRATESIERHVQVIEGLATSVGPLTESVNELTSTMTSLVEVLGPLAAAEQGVKDVERFFWRRRHKDAANPQVEQPGEPPTT